MTDSTDSCEFFIKSDEESNLSIKIQSEDNSKEGLFEIPLIEIESEFLEIPETDYENQVQIASSEVPSAIRDMSFLGDSVDFNISHDEFQLKVQGDCGKGQRSWKNTMCKITTNYDKSLPHSQRFPIKYISLALKATATTQTLLLEFSPNSPLRIRCMLGTKSSIVNFVAPKIDEDD
jgi:proliferating cell nuclear antigen PCNA